MLPIVLVILGIVLVAALMQGWTWYQRCGLDRSGMDRNALRNQMPKGRGGFEEEPKWWGGGR